MKRTFRKFGRYTIEKLLGVGGAGRVYLVHDSEHNRELALKVINIIDPQDESVSRRRFQREFRAALRLSHEHLVKVFEFGVFENQEYYTMEYVEGTDLETHLQLFCDALKANDPVNQKEYIEHCLNLLIQTADALAYLHEKRFVHRDIKPGNILVTKNNIVKVTDFGLIRDLGSAQMTRTGAILGTIEYMSPEQTVTAKVDARSDIFSLGIIAFKMFTGVLPFTGNLMRQLIIRTQEDAPDPKRINPKLNGKIAQVISRMLKRRPEDRFPSAQQLLERLEYIREQLFGDALNSTSRTITVENPRAFLMPPVCVGRDKEIHRLTNAIEKLSQNESSLFLISGEAGIGKTRLAEEARTIAAYHHVLYTKGTVLETSVWEFQTWIDIVFHIRDEFQRWHIPWPEGIKEQFDLLIEMANLLKGKTRPKRAAMMSREAVRYRFFDALQLILTLFSSERPLLIHLEDFHFAKSDCLDIAQYVIRRFLSTQDSSSIETKGILFIITYRNDLTSALPLVNRLKRIFGNIKNTCFIELQRLSLPDVDRMILSMLGSAHASPKFSQRIFQETNGNPLFIESMITTLVEEGHLHRRGNIWVGVISQMETMSDSLTMMLPASVKEGARRRLAGLSPQEKKTGQVASVLGNSFSFDLLLFVSGEDEDTVLDALDTLLRLNILKESSSEDDSYSFVSNILHDVFGESLSETERQYFNKKAAEYFLKNLEILDVSEKIQLAEYLSASGNRLQSIDIISQIIDYFFETGDFYRASVYIERLLPIVVADEFKNFSEILLKRAYCLFKTGRSSEAYQIFIQIIRNNSRQLKKNNMTTDEKNNLLKQLYSALQGILEIFIHEGKYKWSDRIISFLLSHAKELLTPKDIFQTYISAGNLKMFSGQIENARIYFQNALDIAEQLQSSEHMACGLKNLSNIYFYKMDYEKAETLLKDALQHAESIRQLNQIAAIKNNLGNIFKIRGDNERALSFFEEAVSIAENAGDVTNWSLYLHNLASIQKRINQLEDAVLNYRRALALFEEQRNIKFTAMCLNNLGLIYMDRNMLDEALISFRRAYHLYLEQGGKLGAAVAITNVAVIYRESGDRTQALNACEIAQKLYKEIGPVKGFIEYQLIYASLLIDKGNFSDAEQIFQQISQTHLSEKTTEGLFYLTKSEWILAQHSSGNHYHDIILLLEKSLKAFSESNHLFFKRKSAKLLAETLIRSKVDPERGQAILDELSI